MAKDPPIGRIGYVFDGFGEGKNLTGAAKEIFCTSCKAWFDGRYFLCTECDHPRPGFNKYLRSAQLDRHLLGYADIANRQPSRAAVTSDVKLPPRANQ
jgi:hypothetical protein